MDPGAHDAMERLWAVEPAVAERVEQVLDLIEADPTSAAVRRRHLRPPGLWLLLVTRPTGPDVMILWDLDGDTPVVRVLGDSIF